MPWFSSGWILKITQTECNVLITTQIDKRGKTERRRYKWGRARVWGGRKPRRSEVSDCWQPVDLCLCRVATKAYLFYRLFDINVLLRPHMSLLSVAPSGGRVEINSSRSRAVQPKRAARRKMRPSRTSISYLQTSSAIPVLFNTLCWDFLNALLLRCIGKSAPW